MLLLLASRITNIPIATHRALPLAAHLRRLVTMPPSHKPVRRALLLLPPAPSPSSYASLKAAYNAPLFTVLKELATCPSRVQGATLLEIVLPCPHLYGHLDAPRALHYATTQQLVADLYKLICITASREAIDTEDDEGIDARVVLVAYPRNGQLTAPLPDATPEQELQGPVIDMHTLAKSLRVWDAVYSVESEEGEQVLKSFLSSSISQQAVTKVRGGIVSVETSEPEPSADQAVNHLSVAVGGTFDHLHIGHKLLITMSAFMLGRRSPSTPDAPPSVLTVGITGDALLQNKKFAEHLESWKERQRSVHAFLSSLVYFGPENDERVCIREVQAPGPNGHVVNVDYPFGLTIRYVEIWDPFGPTITDRDISALVLSLETRSGGAAVNKKRVEQGWGPLEVFEVAVLDASEEDNVDETFQSKLSSTEIRRKRSERT
ncbi:pantetheine-phosphate adenylyltransferase family protein [Pyrenophora tritici-repentis Pt-1C-BFP]|uniref:Pantetheine-phosphate adenylyltransferase family protein n=2 Tax=Pyrenophora tritici-repentis TaxID=45151 RepID=B2WB07_PYRTR|nr:pantetheine-phosphate adenylyltransferase family protein [Pyrenophora tritici-repentis Pt-1C-BFP]EDU50389.1 pantetheine-phosphate adenylyltransferase family protein [Pyrenophora tritici-repentis Pt-1C-BFP]